MGSVVAGSSPVGLPAEILHEILQLVLSRRVIEVRVRDLKDDAVKAILMFPLSPLLVCKAFYAASHRILDDGLVLCLDSPSAILRLGSILPEVIRNRVKYLQVEWYAGYGDLIAEDGHWYQELENGIFTKQTMLSLPNLDAVLFDGIEDSCYYVEEASNKQEMETRLRQHCDLCVREFLKDRAGIHLEEIEGCDRAIKVHVHVPTRADAPPADQDPDADMHFILATYKSKEKSWTVKDLCHDGLSVSFEEDGRVAISCKKRLAPTAGASPMNCVEKDCVGKECI